jgi:hypothetical protein
LVTLQGCTYCDTFEGRKVHGLCGHGTHGSISPWKVIFMTLLGTN